MSKMLFDRDPGELAAKWVVFGAVAILAVMMSIYVVYPSMSASRKESQLREAELDVRILAVKEGAEAKKRKVQLEKTALRDLQRCIKVTVRPIISHSCSWSGVRRCFKHYPKGYAPHQVRLMEGQFLKWYDGGIEIKDLRFGATLIPQFRIIGMQWCNQLHRGLTWTQIIKETPKKTSFDTYQDRLFNVGLRDDEDYCLNCHKRFPIWAKQRHKCEAK